MRTLFSSLITMSMAAQANYLPDPDLNIMSSGQSTSFTLFADSNLIDAKHGSFVQARVDKVSLEDLSAIQLKTKDGVDVLNFANDEPLEVILFVPRDIDPKDADAFAKEVENSLNRRFSRAVYKIKQAYVPVPHTTGEPGHSRGGLRKWGERSKAIAKYIRNGGYKPEVIDLNLGSVVAGLKSVGGVGYWIAATGFNFFGITQAVLSIALDQIFHRYPAQINKWKADHKISFFQNSWAVKKYNRSPFIKALVTNQLIVLTAQAAFRAMSHFDNPENIRSPLSLEFLGTFAGLGLVGAPLGAAGDMAVMTLLKKGYISRRVAHWIYNLYGIEMQINGLLFGSGRTHLLPYGLALEWGSKGIIWGIAKRLKRKDRRLFILHPGLTPADQDQIEYVNELRHLYLTEDQVPLQTLAEILAKHDDLEMPNASPAKCEAALIIRGR